MSLLGLHVPSEIDPPNDPGVAREHVWSLPWRGNVAFPGLDAIRADATSTGSDAQRRLMLVPNTRALTLVCSGDRVTGVEVSHGGQRRLLPLSARGRVVLAASAIESTRLALESFPSPPMGRNLMIHLRSDLVVRIKRSVFGLLGELETSALLVRGEAHGRRFHLQIVAVNSQISNPDESLFRMIPDIEMVESLLDSLDSEWVTLVFRSLGETVGNRTSPVPNDDSWIDLSPHAFDEFGFRRAWVQLTTNPTDVELWKTMERCSLDLAAAIAGASSNTEYLHGNGWHASPPNLDAPFPPWRRGLGTTYHESGTLWMGEPGASVTDTNARFHHMANAYACDQSLFPTVGSANPVITGHCLARRLANHLATVL